MAAKHKSKSRLKKRANSKRVRRPARRRRAAKIVSLVPAQAVREGRLAETPEVPRDEEAIVSARVAVDDRGQTTLLEQERHHPADKARRSAARR